jgi:acyl-CoA thioesterase-1
MGSAFGLGLAAGEDLVMRFIPGIGLCAVFLIMAVSLPGHNRAVAAETSQTLLAFGDSLVSGYGLESPNEAFPAQLEQKLGAKGATVKVVNAGVAGDTTGDGLNRLEWTLERQKPDAVILVLGGNDMLRGLDPALTRKNLHQILDILRANHLPVLLAGMRAFKNLQFGRDDDYKKMYHDLAKDEGDMLYPFYLQAVIDKDTGAPKQPGLFQEDGLHPAAKGVSLIVDDMLPSVTRLLAQKKG